MAFDLEKLKTFPTSSGVYLMKDSTGLILYIGKAKNLRVRVKQYFVPYRDNREMVPFLIKKVDHIDFIITPNEKEALLLENTLIKTHQPQYNILLKDDKTFISLMINHQHKWPMVRLMRYKNKPSEKGLFFGPYISATSAKETFEVMNEIFPLRQCSDSELKKRKRPCLLYSIKKCIAPCVNKCTKEEYDEYVQDAISFLKGENDVLISELKKKMHEASEKLEYEKAGALLTTIKRITTITSQGKNITHSFLADLDAIGLYRQYNHVMLVRLHYREGRLINSEYHSILKTAADDSEILSSFLLQLYQTSAPPPLILLPKKINDIEALEEILSEIKQSKIHITIPQKGDKKKIINLANENALASFHQENTDQFSKEDLLMQLQETLQLNRCPIKIECFDTSNISLTDAVASLVAFTNGEKDPSRYRLYQIKEAKQADDYSAMKEILSRRFSKKNQENDFPDLVIMDGGKGQLNIAVEILKELDIANVDVISLTKESAKHTKSLTKEKIFVKDVAQPIILEPTNAILFFLQNIRDEAHRRAINFHRKKRSKRTISSSLDRIPGIGPKKKKALLNHFGSISEIKKASYEELIQVKSLTKKDCQTILESFTSQKS